MKRRIFVGSSREAVSVARAVQAELSDEFDITVWDQGVFQLSQAGFDSLLDVLDSSDAGIFVMRADDVTTRRETSMPSVRDNVVFELGMFVGRLGPDRTFMLTPNVNPPDLPSDLNGVTTARYDARRFEDGERRPAVATACTQIRERMAARGVRVPDVPESRKRLDRAMARMSRDLESLLGGHPVEGAADTASETVLYTTRIEHADVYVEIGRIEDYVSTGRSVVALPANEYFDDECVSDVKSALGAYVDAHFKDSVLRFLEEIQTELRGIPSEQVPRAERRIGESYGIGQAIFLRGLAPSHRVILVSATTERTGIGLRAEPHFLYAAMQGVVETMNANRIDSVALPVLGSGHGGMPLVVALLFNLLAVRSCLTEDVGRHVREVRIVVFEGGAGSSLTQAGVEEIAARVVTS
jgi:O-acetyl-ADP-ribose deacetylase (regulator of RNase III)